MKRLIALAWLIMSTSAHAGLFYVNNGVGLSQIRSGDPFFGSGVGSPQTLGLHFTLGLYWGVGSGQNPIDFQIGFEPRLNTGSDTNASYSTLSIYPVARLQVSRAYLGVGWAPMVYKRVGSALGFDGFQLVQGAKHWMAEAGMLFPMTPEFSMGLGMTAEFLKSDLGTSPITYSGVVSMRYYFAQTGDSSGGGSSRRSNEHRGWRYPFGYMR